MKKRDCPDIEDLRNIYLEFQDDLPSILVQLASLIVADINMGVPGCEMK